MGKRNPIRQFVLRFAQRVSKRDILEQDISAYRTAQVELYKKWGIKPYNPDTLAQKKGLQVYRKMIKTDSQIKSIQTLRKDSRLSTGWEIVPASDEEPDIELAEFVRYSIDQLRGTLEDSLGQILSAMDYGYSITEKNYRYVEEGKYAGKVIVDNMKTRDPINFGFIDDDHGNLTALELKNTIQGTNIPIPELDKFIIYSHNKEFDNWYGESDLRSIYKDWWSKDTLEKFWNIMLERFANPHFVGKYPEGTQEKEQKAFRDMLDNLQSASTATIPATFDITVIGGDKLGRGASFKLAIDYRNKMIARGLLTPTLIVDEGDRSGSFALGKKHFDIFVLTLNKMGRVIEENIMGEQYIRPLVDLNFPNVQNYPNFRFRPIEEMSQEAKAEFIDRLVKAGLIDPTEPWVRDFLAVPHKEEGAETSVKSTEVIQIPSKVSMVKEKFREMNEQEKRAEMSEIEKYYDDRSDEAKKNLGKVIEAKFSDLIDKVKKLDFSKITTIKQLPKMEVDLGKAYQAGVKNFMMDFYNKGRMDVRQEVNKAKKEDKFSELSLAALEPEAALEWLDEYADFLAGWDNDNLKREAKLILMQGLKEGAPASEIVKNMRDSFGKYVSIGGEFKAAKLDTLIRTNSTLAYNQGRLTEMRDPDVKDRIPAYRYSAIIDERTTEICETLDGRIFGADDPAWDTWTPPNHFNCRSVILPVFEGEVQELSAKTGVPEVPQGFGLTDRFTVPTTIIKLMEDENREKRNR